MFGLNIAPFFTSGSSGGGASGVSSYNGRTGAVTESSSDVTTALGFTPLASNGSGASLTGIVTTFNTRIGAVTLTGSDVTTALAYTPVNQAGDTITGTTTINKTAQSGVAELIFVLSVSDDATAKIAFNNSSSANAQFLPRMACTAAGTGTPLTLECNITTDTGTGSAFILNGKLAAGGAIATRNLMIVQNNGSTRFTVAQDGLITLTAPAQLKSYTVATLTATPPAGQIAYASDAAVAPCVCFGNGSVWKRCDNAATTVV